MYSPHTQPARATRAGRNARRVPVRRSAMQSQLHAGQNWRQAAIAAYRQSEQADLAALREELADRIADLTGRPIAPAAIYADRDAQLAILNVEGTVFRLRNHELAIIRRCVHCGVGHFESPAITTLSELGYALDAWEPRCEHCALEDDANWLDAE
jgi:kynureninase